MSESLDIKVFVQELSDGTFTAEFLKTGVVLLSATKNGLEQLITDQIMGLFERPVTITSQAIS